jgi:hypothetical protein
MATPARVTRGGAAHAETQAAADRREQQRAQQARDKATLRELDADLDDGLRKDSDRKLKDKAEAAAATCRGVVVRALPLARWALVSSWPSPWFVCLAAEACTPPLLTPSSPPKQNNTTTKKQNNRKR